MTTEPIVEIVAVTYDHGYKIKCFINSIKAQTNQNWFLHIVHDGPGDLYDDLVTDLNDNNYIDDRIHLSCTDKRYNDWGHTLRDYGLKNIKTNSRYITVTNCDNYYSPVWIDELAKVPSEMDFVFWDCVHSHLLKKPKTDKNGTHRVLNAQLHRAHIDMGCAAIKRNIARDVGFPFRNHDGDWDFFHSCLVHIPTSRRYKIEKVLFTHN